MIKWCDRVILWTLLVLVFFLPLVYDPRLFDVVSLPKVTLLRFCVLIMAAAWLVKLSLGVRREALGEKSALRGLSFTPYSLRFTHNLLTWPVLGFLGICILGTIFSIDPKLSFFGVYKFYFWGLGSILCYVLLYFIVVSSLRPEDIDKILLVLLCSGALVSIVGITQHFGFGITHWGKAPRDRVISTLGNPNFLGAYLVMVIPVGISRLIKRAAGSRQVADKERRRVSGLRFLLSALCSLSFYSWCVCYSPILGERGLVLAVPWCCLG